MQPQDQTPPSQPETPLVPTAPAAPIPQPSTQQPSTATGQNAPYNPKYAVPSPIQDYKQVPFYRRRWFVLTLTLLIVPVGFVFVWTGNVYLKNQKTKVVYMLTKLQKVYFTLAGLVIILNNILRLH